MRTASRRLALLLATATLACGARTDKAVDPDRLDLLGRRPFSPLPKPDFTLTDTEGRPFYFRNETDGHITLLYFGYTYCPDVCPLEMSTLAAALPELSPEVRARIRVVFVSVDPDRDTPERLHEWLSSFDPSFVGLRGTTEEVAQALDFYHFPAPKQSGEPDGYTVSHPASMYAFTPDNLGRGMYGTETTKAVWVHDLNVMADHDWSRAEAAAAATSASPSTQDSADSAEARPLATAGDVDILDAYLPRPAAGNVTALYLTLRNGGAAPDTLLGISANFAARGTLHDMTMVGGETRMGPLVGGLALPPGQTVALEPGGRHGMLEGLTKELEPGSTELVVLRFARAGPIAVPARVVRYEDLVR